MRSACMMRSASVLLHKKKLPNVQRRPSNVQHQENLLQILGFLPPLLNLPSKCNFGSPLDFLHNGMTS